MTLIHQVLAPGCFGVEVEDAGQDVPLCSLEAGFVACAAPKRQRDFALGRFCAHEALARMNRDQPAIPVAASGAAIWPPAVVGSITHTDGYAAAAVALQGGIQAVGIDAERVGGVTEALMPRLFGAAEREWLMALGAQERDIALTIFFSAKESFYKALGGQARLPFQDIHVEMRGDDGFAVHHLNRAAQGRLAVRGNLVVTAVILP